MQVDVRDADSTPGLGTSPVEGHSNPLQYSCLENPMDRGAWWVTVHWVAKSQTRLSDLAHTCTYCVLDACSKQPSVLNIIPIVLMLSALKKQ